MQFSTTVHGLRDGQHTAGTGLLLRKIKALGAKVTLASTGRVTVIDARGDRHVYVLVLDVNIDTSPLTQALADLETAVGINMQLTESDKETLLVAKDLLLSGRIAEALLLATAIPALALDEYQTACRTLIVCDPSPKVGDLLTYGWGYDQTNIEHYQVVAVTASGKVRIRRIASRVARRTQYDDYMAPVRDNFDEGVCLHCRQSLHTSDLGKRCERWPFEFGPDQRVSRKHEPDPSARTASRGYRYADPRGVLKTPDVSNSGYRVQMDHGGASLDDGTPSRQTGAMYGH